MQEKKNMKYNSKLFGFIAGIIVPLIVMSIFYLSRNPKYLELFWKELVSANIISRMVSLCVVPNLLVFFIFMWRNKLNSAYGVIGATFIYAFVVLVLTTFV
jgi:hypothetical protein